jgi:phage baseplate assembly protein V
MSATTHVHRLFRRIWNMLAAGTVAAINDTGTVMQLQIQLGYMEVHTLPAPQHFGFSSVPPVGSNTVSVYIAGDRSNGIIVATNNQTLRPANKQSGEAMVYDAWGRQIYLSVAGIVVNANGAPVTVNDATTVTINASTEVVMNTPLLEVSGDIQDNFGSNADTMRSMRTTYNQHDHGNVENGDGTTSTPTPQM